SRWHGCPPSARVRRCVVRVGVSAGSRTRAAAALLGAPVALLRRHRGGRRADGRSRGRRGGRGGPTSAHGARGLRHAGIVADALQVHFALHHDEYWLRLECPEEEDEDVGGVDPLQQKEPPPVLQGAFIAGFEYTWAGRKTLADLVEEYYAYATRIDDAIGHIKEIDAHEVRLIGYDLAEMGGGAEEDGTQGTTEEGTDGDEDGGVSLRVRLRVAGGVGEVRLRVAVNDPLAYPRAIRFVEKGELLKELKADNWQSGESLVANLVELFSEVVAAGEVAEAYKKSAMEGGEEENWEMEW
ncbi:hypothetical protein PMAYCL1PPCAC_04039, partial [Pristionchus mayeri]